MIENRLDYLDEMMDDLKKAPYEYRPGNFWEYYIPTINKQLKGLDLNEFRRQALTAISVQTFGGGSDEGTFHGWNIHPFSPLFEKFDSCLPVRGYNRLINLFAKLFSLAGIFSFRASIARRYYNLALRKVHNSAYYISQLHDSNHDLEKIEESPEGSPHCFTADGRKYTLYFLDKFLEYVQMKNIVDFSHIKYVLEIGGGIGIQAVILMKCHPHLKVCLVDIPPSLYVAQQYLDALFPGEVLKYHEAKRLKSINSDVMDKYKVVCLAPWMFKSLNDDMFDLFINSESFQEMEPWIVENYLSEVKRCTKKWIYLKNLSHGSPKGTKGKGGVLKPTSRVDYIKYCKPEFELVKEEPAISVNGINNDFSAIIFKGDKTL